MKQLLHLLARELAPPIALKGARNIASIMRGPAPAREWEWLPGGFEQARADAKVKGWNQQSVTESNAASLHMMRSQLNDGVPIGLNRAHDAADAGAVTVHNVALTWAYVIGRVAKPGQTLSVLDWGGALGRYFLLARKLWPDLSLDYTIKEMPVFVEQGAELMPEVKFRCDAEVLEEKFDLVVASGALHYDEQWRQTFEQLAGCARAGLFVTRSPTTLAGESYVYVQRPYGHGYQTEYASWCLNRAEVLAAGERCGLKLEREFLVGENPPIYRAPSPCEYRGFLWLR